MEKGDPASLKTTEIEHVDDVLGVLKELYLSESYADVVFVVQGERIHAHRAILAARSEYFCGLLFGGLAEAQQREINQDFELEPFKEILRYIYTGRLSIATTAEHITQTLGILELAQFLMLPKLVSDIMKLVEGDLALDNVTAVSNCAAASHLDELSSACLALMDSRAFDYIQHESFKTLSKVLVESILERDSFAAPEVEIFRATLDWYRANPISENKSVFGNIRLSVMGDEEMENIVKPAGIFTDDELFAAILAHNHSKNLPYRHCMAKNKVISFVPNRTEGTGAVFELAVTTSINHIHVTFGRECNLGYTVEISRDNIQWKKVIDYRKFGCKSMQDLYFEPRLVHYIKFRWEANQSKVLNVETSYAMFSDAVPELVDGIIAPIENVITKEKATFKRCTFQGGMISVPHYEDFPIIIKLNQPYHIGSLRWAVQNYPNFSLQISTSIDGDYWKIACTGQDEDEDEEWNHRIFEPRTVLFVKMFPDRFRNFGTVLLKLEMPSQDPDVIAKRKKNCHLRAPQL